MLVVSRLGLLCRGIASCALSSALVLLAHPAAADELGPILLTYRAAPGCPEVAEFQRRVEARSNHVHFVDEGSHDRELSIRLIRQGEFVRGELRLIETDGSLRQRSVRFTSCAEAVEGLALITAVSLDPNAQLAPLPSASSPPSDSSPPRASNSSARSSPPSEPAVAVRPSPPRRTFSSAAPLARAPSALELGLGMELESALQLLPAAPVGAGLYLDVGSSKRAGFAPLLRLTASHVQRRAIREPGVDANFALTSATLSVCPLKLASAQWVVRPCGFTSAGLLRAWGSNTSDPHQNDGLFGSWGASGLVLWQLTPDVALSFSLAGGATLIRNRYVLDQELVWSTPTLYLSGGLGFRFRLQ